MCAAKFVRGVVVAFCLLICLASRLPSTTVEKMSLEQIVRHSKVVVGNVLEMQKSRKYPYLGYMEAKIEVTRVIKGKQINAGDVVLVDGCTTTGTRSFVGDGIDQFDIAERVIVCLAKRDDGVFEVTGSFQGKFSIVGEQIKDMSISVEDFIRHIEEFLSGKQDRIGLSVKNSQANSVSKVYWFSEKWTQGV